MEIGNVRNQVSHAMENETTYENWKLNEQNERMKMLNEVISGFIRLYERVRSGVNKKENDSVLITSEEFRQYRKTHMIKKSQN